jgi:hypothetical protein
MNIEGANPTEVRWDMIKKLYDELDDKTKTTLRNEPPFVQMTFIMSQLPGFVFAENDNELLELQTRLNKYIKGVN